MFSDYRLGKDAERAPHPSLPEANSAKADKKNEPVLLAEEEERLR